MFKGSMVAIVTPFKNGKVDEKALGDLIEFHIKNGTDVLVPCGTTGESATLSHEEHHRVVEFTVKTVNKRVPVVAGAGSNSTDETLELTKFARKAGANGVLLITPYYNKPTQEGLYQHFKKVAESVDIPIVLWTREPIASQKEARQLHGADELVAKSGGTAALVARVIALFRRVH